MIKSIVTLGSVALLAGCRSIGLGFLDSDVEVRIENRSAVALDRVVVYPGGRDSVVATNLATNAQTPYREVDRAYQIVTVEATVGTQTVRQQVIDYVGETPLGGGRYTYRVRFVPTTGHPELQVELTED